MNLLKATCFSQISKGFLASLFITLLFSPAAAQNTKQNLAKNANREPKIVEAKVHYSAASYKPSNRRDPFLNPLVIKKGAKKDEDEEESRGTPPPGIGGTFIAQAVLQGLSIRDTGKTAVVRGADSRAYFLREGDRLFDGYLKSIENDSITLIRETKMKSGKLITQEVIKRLRTP
jgi:hypothetical protein